MVVLNIVWPTFALVAVVFVVWLTLVVQRMSHIRRNPPRAEDFASGDSSRDYFRSVEMPANNLANLFEMPILYFALVPLLLITQQASVTQAILAWCYVGLRAVHSVIHIGPKKIQPRFMVYLASCAVLSAMWIGFFIDMTAAAYAYNQAMSAMRPLS